jgi:hypothetical protein
MITAWYVGHAVDGFARPDSQCRCCIPVSIFSLYIDCDAEPTFRLFGYDQGVMSGLLTGRAFTAQFPEIGELKLSSSD